MQSKCVPPVCMALAMLFKTRSKHMSSVQAVVSILLKAVHVTSEVRIAIVVLLMCSRVHTSCDVPYCILVFCRPTHGSTSWGSACLMCRLCVWLRSFLRDMMLC